MLILSTGSNQHYEIGDTEAFVISEGGNLDRCSHTNLDSPKALSMTTGGFLKSTAANDSSYYPLICGGRNSEQSNRNCYIFGEANLKPVGNLIHHRKGAASVVIGNGTTHWVTGGHNEILESQASTEFVTVVNNNGTIKINNEVSSVTLPSPMAFHCLQMIGSSTAFLYGGVGYGTQINRNSLFEANFRGIQQTTAANWIPSGSLKQARKEHMCGVLRDPDLGQDDPWRIIIAAGGITSYHKCTSTVEVLRVKDSSNVNVMNLARSKWVSGPHLPIPLCCAASATTHDQGRLFIAGGLISESPYQQSLFVFSLTCPGKNCQWTKNDLELSYGRTSTIAMIIPPVNPEEGQVGTDPTETTIADTDTNLLDCATDDESRGKSTIHVHHGS